MNGEIAALRKKVRDPALPRSSSGAFFQSLDRLTPAKETKATSGIFGSGARFTALACKYRGSGASDGTKKGKRGDVPVMKKQKEPPPHGEGSRPPGGL
ncbi:hypothetical protein HPB50_022214 [Hyalomma asiaticum]|uniref:Uncharacterized protein n=1 Tax=Hyalomma asiaticum TaxID=266040 RepID=A0ACB7SEF5_HYAAI|nr:hypothetical protein HPB50_022214 [Hyalomma asiaticum]